jgi:2,3-dihydroxyphenylpropionate 1,2-dioxygenase
MTLCASHAPGLDRDAAGEYGKEFRLGLAAARHAVQEFAPEVVVLFAGDHRRAFTEISPAFAVAESAQLLAEGSISAEQLSVPVELTRALCEALLADDFDIAVCRGVALDHAFGQPLQHFLSDVSGIPVVPVAVNCASPPLPRARRVSQFGARVGQFFGSVRQRVLFIGTGGLSHNPPTLVGDRYDLTEQERRHLRETGFEAAAKLIKPAWDIAFLEALERYDVDELVRMTDNATAEAGVGANEVRTWLAAAAAGGGHGVATVVYEPVPNWITGMGVAMSAPV